eukprot:gene6769-9272_t
MSYLLHITVSPNGDNSSSIAVGKEFINAFKESHPDVPIVVRDLNTNPVPHLDGETIVAGFIPEEARTPSQTAKYNARLALVEEALGAKYILIDTPMWQWNVPSVLKAYIDHLILVGKADAYTRPFAGKYVTSFIASGGGYGDGSPHPENDHETDYLRFIPTILGSTDVTVTRVEYTLAGVVPGMDALIPNKLESLKLAKETAIKRAQELP